MQTLGPWAQRLNKGQPVRFNPKSTIFIGQAFFVALWRECLRAVAQIRV